MPAVRLIAGETMTLGWLMALVIGIIAVIAFFLGHISTEATLVVLAVCAVRL